MPSPGTRGDRLRALAAHAADFARDAAGRFERGGRLAEADTQRLMELAETVAGDLRDWSRAIETLEVGGDAALTIERAARLVLETVFDEALSPPAARLLAASLDLALGEP